MLCTSSMQSTVQKETVLTRNPAIFASKVDSDLVMMDENQGVYFSLNTVGGNIWELLEKPRSYSELLSELAKRYEISLEKTDHDVKPFIESLIQHGLVKPKEG